MGRLLLKCLITVIALAAATAHLVFPGWKIDYITAVFLVVAIIPWLDTLLKSVTLPGGFSIQYQDLKNASDSLQKSGLLKEDKGQAENLESFQVDYPDVFTKIDGQDPQMALLFLKTETEKNIREIAQKNQVDDQRYPVAELLGILYSKKVFSATENLALQNLLITLNKAIQSHVRDNRYTTWVRTYGPGSLAALSKKKG